MVTKTAVIRAIEGRMAVVVTMREDACSHCEARGACDVMGGTGANAEVRALNTIDAEVGDTVTIAMASSSLMKASFLIYMVPILALIAGILIGFQINKVFGIPENVAVGISSGVGLVGAFAWLKKKGKELGGRREFIPEIIGKKDPARIGPQTPSSCSVR